MKSVKLILVLLFVLLFLLQGCVLEKREGLSPSVGAEDPLSSEISKIKISHINMKDEKRGWSHHYNKLLRTDDGGSSWVNASPKLESLNAGEYFFLDEKVAWIYQQENEILKIYYTNDGGENWISHTTIIEGSNPRLYFLNENEGWLMTTEGASMFIEGVFLYRSEDSGATWEKIENNILEYLDGRKGKIFFKNQEEGWVSLSFFTEKSNVWLLHTKDGGESWQKQYLQIDQDLVMEYSYVYAPIFVDNNNGILPIHTTCHSIKCTLFYFTNDGGEEWQYASTLTHGNAGVLFMVDVVDQQTIWTANKQGLYLSVDFGKNWEKIDIDFFNKEQLEIVQIDFISKQVGWIIVKTETGHFKLLFTNDGGHNWVERNPTLIHSPQ